MSWIAARNRTIDRAPTSPRESASEDFTTKMMTTVTMVSIGNTPEKLSRLEMEVPKRL